MSTPKHEYIETHRIALDVPSEPRYTVEVRDYVYYVQLTDFTTKIIGKHYVDGEYVNDWVQYL